VNFLNTGEKNIHREGAKGTEIAQIYFLKLRAVRVFMVKKSLASL